jgi:hypothetical protein
MCLSGSSITACRYGACYAAEAHTLCRKYSYAVLWNTATFITYKHSLALEQALTPNEYCPFESTFLGPYSSSLLTHSIHLVNYFSPLTSSFVPLFCPLNLPLLLFCIFSHLLCPWNKGALERTTTSLLFFS